MKIQLVGCPCAKTTMLSNRLNQAIYMLNLDGEVEQIRDPEMAGSLGVLLPPGILVEGRLLVEFRIPSVEELVILLKHHLEQSGHLLPRSEHTP